MVRPGQDGIACRVDPGEHHQARQSRRIGSGDIGVKPVPHHQRCAKVPARQRVLHQRRRGLTRHQGFGAGGGPHRRDQRSVARHQTTFGGQGHVQIGRHPQCPGPDRQRRLGEFRPPDAHRKTLHDGDGFIGD